MSTNLSCCCCCLQLLQQDPKKRLDNLEALKQENLMKDVDWEAVEAVNVQPGFVPPVSCSNSLDMWLCKKFNVFEAHLW